MQAQMVNRKERLQFLIRFINENGVLTKVMVITPTSSILRLTYPRWLQMAQRSRQKLATNDEKLYAARQLWSRYRDLTG